MCLGYVRGRKPIFRGVYLSLICYLSFSVNIGHIFIDQLRRTRKHLKTIGLIEEYVFFYSYQNVSTSILMYSE